MEVAFIVKLDLPDTNAIEGVSEDLMDSISSDGYSVISCQPWHRESLAAVASLAQPLNQPSELGGSLPTL